MNKSTESFPTGLESIFVIIGLFAGEYFFSALLYDFKDALGIGKNQITAITSILGSGLIFSALVSYKKISYSSIFHNTKTSATAIVSVLTIPIILLVPGLILVVWTVHVLVLSIFPLSNREIIMFEQMMSRDLASIINICVIAPMVEEMLFRGIILRSFLTQYTTRAAIIGSAAIFGIAHMNIYQFFVGLILGTILGWLYERTKSLWPCIILHAAYNSTVMLFAILDSSLEEGELWSPGVFHWVAAFALFAVGTTLLKKLLTERNASLTTSP